MTQGVIIGCAKKPGFDNAQLISHEYFPFQGRIALRIKGALSGLISSFQGVGAGGTIQAVFGAQITLACESCDTALRFIPIQDISPFTFPIQFLTGGDRQ